MFNILVAEDDSDIRELFCTVLSDSGYNAIPAADGAEALEIIDREYIDLIVADIMMPNVDGCELTRSLRDAKYDLPILMVTAKDQFADMQRGFRMGSMIIRSFKAFSTEVSVEIREDSLPLSRFAFASSYFFLAFSRFVPALSRADPAELSWLFVPFSMPFL